MRCSFCNFEIETPKGLKNHYTKKHSDISEITREIDYQKQLHGEVTINNAIEQYKSETVCVNDLVKQGLHLSKLLGLLGLKRSNSEEKKTKRYKNLVERTILEKYGVKNISQHPGVKQKVKNAFHEKYGGHSLQRPEIRLKVVETIRKKSKHEKQQIVDKIKNTMIAKYGVSSAFMLQHSVKHRIFNQRCAPLSTRRHRTLNARKRLHVLTTDSNLETVFKEFLLSNHVLFEQNVSVDGFIFDFKIDQTLIEINGETWHFNPNQPSKFATFLNKEYIIDKDKRKQQSAISNGFKPVIIWESELFDLSFQQFTTFI